jgi:hypothetical protein
MKLYGVVTMDIVGSRNLVNRPDIQELLDEYIQYINEKYLQYLAAPVSFTLGDEWQLITNCPSKVYDFVHLFQQKLWGLGVRFYAGIGIGELSTAIYNDVRKMDGECFIAARQAIEISKNKMHYSRRNNYVYSKNNKVFFKYLGKYQDNSKTIFDTEYVLELLKNVSEFDLDDRVLEVALSTDIDEFPQRNITMTNDISFRLAVLENVINLIIENNEILKDKMTNKQKEIYVQQFNTGSYRKIVEQYGGSISNISQSLNVAQYYAIQNNHSMVKVLIKIYCLLILGGQNEL